MARTYRLIEPLTIKMVSGKGEREEVIGELVLDLPEDGKIRARHLRATDGHSGRIGMHLAMISFLSGVPLKALDELVGEDLIALMDIVEDFQSPGQTTGETA